MLELNLCPRIPHSRHYLPMECIYNSKGNIAAKGGVMLHAICRLRSVREDDVFPRSFIKLNYPRNRVFYESHTFLCVRRRGGEHIPLCVYKGRGK